MISRSRAHHHGFDKPKVLRLVTLGSATGRYGGPFDTARRQAAIAESVGYDALLEAGVIHGDAPKTTQIENLFVVRSLVPRLGFSGLFSIAAARAINLSIRRADVVHISFARELVPLYGTLIALLRRKRLILQPHGMLTSRVSKVNSLIDLVALPLLRRADKVVALTSVEERELIALAKLQSTSLTVLGNPLPDDVQPPGEPLVRVSDEVLFLARLHPRKRVGDFVDAAALAHEKNYRGRYLVVGPDGGDLGLVQRTNLPNLSYGGAVAGSAVTATVESCTIFALLSQNEPWGNVLTTALALGKPVIVTASSALAPAVSSFDAGIVVRDGDASEVADAVHALLTDDSAYSSKSKGALRLTREILTRDAQVEALDALYGNWGRTISLPVTP